MLDSRQQDIKQQINFVASELGLDDFVVEKDLYVTQVVSIVSKIFSEFYDLVFQGGTSLAKAHRIIERMSEDCDFRVRIKDPDAKRSKEFKRRALRDFRHELIRALKANEFSVDNVKVRNEGQFMELRVN